MNSNNNEILKEETAVNPVSEENPASPEAANPTSFDGQNSPNGEQASGAENQTPPTNQPPLWGAYGQVPPYGYGQPPYGYYPPVSGYYQQGYNQNSPYNCGFNPEGYYPPNGQYYQPPAGGYYPPYGAPPYGYYPPQPFFNQPSPEELKRRQEKKKVRHVANAIGIPLCLFSVISFVISVIAMVVLELTLGQGKANAILADPDFNYILSALISAICFTLPFLITSKLTGIKWRDTMEFKKTSSTKFISVIMLGLGICALSNYASSFISSIMEQTTGKGSETTMTEFGSDWKSFIISLVCVGIMPALLEEFGFRGVVLGTLRRYMSDGAAIFVSAALFGLLHGNLQQIPFAFGVGLALGYATVYCKSIIPAMVLHGINNSVAVVMDFATRIMSPLNSQLVTMLYMAVLLLIGLCGFIMLTVTDKEAFKLSGDSSDSKTRVGWVSSSPAIIVFFVLTGLSIIGVQFLG